MYVDMYLLVLSHMAYALVPVVWANSTRSTIRERKKREVMVKGKVTEGFLNTSTVRIASSNSRVRYFPSLMIPRSFRTTLESTQLHSPLAREIPSSNQPLPGLPRGPDPANRLN